MITGISSWVRPFIAEAGIAKMSFSKFLPSKGDLHLAVIRNAHDAIMTSHIELTAEAPALATRHPDALKSLTGVIQWGVCCLGVCRTDLEGLA